MYGVVVCSRCGRPKAADLRRKTSSCQCGYRIDLRTAVVRFRHASALRVAEAVRAMTAEPGREEPPSGRGRDAVESAVDAASLESGRWPKASRLAEVLTAEQGSFTLEEFELAAGMLDLDRAGELLEGLLARGALVRRADSRYSFV